MWKLWIGGGEGTDKDGLMIADWLCEHGIWNLDLSLSLASHQPVALSHIYIALFYLLSPKSEEALDQVLPPALWTWLGCSPMLNYYVFEIELSQPRAMASCMFNQIAHWCHKDHVRIGGLIIRTPHFMARDRFKSEILKKVKLNDFSI